MFAPGQQCQARGEISVSIQKELDQQGQVGCELRLAWLASKGKHVSYTYYSSLPNVATKPA